MSGDTFKFTMIGDDQLTRPLRNAENQMKSLGNQVTRTNKQMGAFSSNLANAGRGTRAFAMGSLQQAGYQVGDFAVQIANGTNKMQAFGQQAPQFLQIFGPIGSVVGAAVAVFAAAAVMIEKTRATTENLSKSVDKANASITAFSASAKNSNKSVAELAKEYGIMASQAKEFFEVQNEINRLVAFRDVASAIELATQSFGEFGDRTVGALHDQGEAFDALQHKIKSLREEGEASDYFNIEEGLNRQLLIADESLNRMADNSVVKLARELGISGSAAAFLAEELSKAQRAENLEDRVKGLVEVRRIYRDLALADGKISEEEQKRLNSLLEAQMSYLKISATLQETTGSIAKINEGEVYHDSILRQQAIAQSNLVVQYNQMVEAQKDRKKFLDDELIVMQQVVKQSGILLTNMQKFRPDKVYGGRGGDPRKQTADYMNQLGYTSVADLIEQLSDKGPKAINKVRQEIVKLSPEAQRMADLGDAIGQSFENAFMGAIDGTKSAKEAFKSMASEIISELYRVFIVKKLQGLYLALLLTLLCLAALVAQQASEASVHVLF